MTYQANNSQAIQENKIEKPNYTQIPNIIYDYWLPKLSPSAFTVLSLICRKTFGWHKTSDTISKNQLIKLTGITKNTIQKSIEELQKNNLLIVHQSTNEYGNQPNVYSLNIQKPKDNLYDGQNLGGGRSNSDLGGRSNIDPTKERVYKINKKENKQRKENAESKDSLESKDSHLCSLYLFEKLKKVRLDRKVPDWNKWDKEITNMIKQDKRTKDKIIKMIDWLFDTDNKFVVGSTKSLREKYDNIADHMIDEVNKANESLRYKEDNIQWLKGKISYLERVGAKGNLRFNDHEVIDSVLKRSHSLNAKNMIDIVSSWDKLRR